MMREIDLDSSEGQPMSLLLMSHKMALGGTEKALLSFLEALRGKNVHVVLILLEEGGELFDQIPDWVEVKILDVFEEVKETIFDPPLSLAKRYFYRADLINTIKTLIRYLNVKLTKRWYLNYKTALSNYPNLLQADLAIAFAGPSDFISYFILERVQAEQKIQWIHFDVSKVIYDLTFGNKFYARFDRIFCVSANAKNMFDQTFPALVNKTEVFQNIVSEKELVDLATKGEGYTDNFTGIRILTVGRLSKEKGQDMIAEVVCRLKKQFLDFRWYLVGDGGLLSEIEEQIKECDVADHLVLLGSQVNPYRYMRDCTLYVQTSLHEGYCLTLHEAKMFNKPVVTTAVVSAENLIVHNQDGLIVDISQEGLYEGVKSILENRILLTKFGQALLAKESISEISKLNI